MRKVLFIAYYCPPFGGGGVPRSMKFIKYLPDFSWEPVVITARENAPGMKDFSLLNEIPDNIKIYREFAITPFFFFRVLKKIGLSRLRKYLEEHWCIPDKLAGWAFFAFYRAKKIIKEEKIDVIYTTSPPHSSHLIGLRLKKIFPAVPWIADFRDAWCENPFRTVKKNQLRNRIEEKWEKKVMQQADNIIFNTHSSLDIHKQKYDAILSNKSFVIPNGFDPADFKAIHTGSNAVYNEKFTILHTGDIYGIRTLKPLIEALQLFIQHHKKDQDKLRVIFAGSVKEEEKALITQAHMEQLFEFKNFLPYHQCIKEVVNADMLLIVTGRGEHKVMVPGKFYEYLGAHVPILAICDKGELNRILEECHAGDWAPLDDPEKIYRAIVRYFDNRHNRTFFKPDDKMIRRFERRTLTEQLSIIFNNNIRK